MRRTLMACAAGLFGILGLSQSAQAQWQVRQTYLNTSTSTGNASGGTLANQLENIDEGEALLAGATGFVQSGNFTDSPQVINYSGANFPGSGGSSGNATEDFALEAVGVVGVINGSTGTFNLVVNSDDGFRLRRNGTTIFEFTGPTGNSNTGLNNVTLNDGDVLRLTFFERGGGEKLLFQVDADGLLGNPNSDPGAAANDRIFVGAAASGISIVPIPEPATAGLIGVAAVGLLARRRRPSAV